MATLICPCCGFENDPSARNCQLCNYEFDQQVFDVSSKPSPKVSHNTKPMSTVSSQAFQKRKPVQQPQESLLDQKHSTFNRSNSVTASNDSLSDQRSFTFDTLQHAEPDRKKKIRIPIIIVCVLLAILGFMIAAVKKSIQSSDKPNPSDSKIDTSSVNIQATTAPADEVVSSGYVDAGSNDFATVYEAADTSSKAVARAYTDDTVDIYAMENNWYRVKFGSVIGYLPAEFVTFSEPIIQTEAPAVEIPTEAATAAPTQAPTQAPQTQPVQKPTCSANITVDTSGSGDGGTFYLNVSGSFAYYTYSARAYYSGGDYEDLGQFKSSDAKVKLTAGSVFSYVTATVIPYSIDGTYFFYAMM